jgi:hypothetical protein
MRSRFQEIPHGGLRGLAGPCMSQPLESRAPVISGSGMLVAVDTGTCSLQGPRGTFDSMLDLNRLLWDCLKRETIRSLQSGQVSWDRAR